MAYITGSVIDSFGVLPFSLSAGTQLSMSIQNSLPGVSYYGLETVPDGNGFYNPTTPRNLSGSFILGSGIVDVVYDNYKMVAAVAPGGGTLTYTPAVAIEADTLRTRGTGASLGPVDFGTLLASSYSKRVTTAGGYVESPDSITAAIAATPILKDASFLYIPSGYSSGTAFSELSTNDYGDLTWTRASDGTRTNSEGLVQRVPWNLFQYSEDFSNVYWTKSATSISANSTTAPNGTLTADTLTANGTSGQHFVRGSYDVTSGTVYTVSFYAKKDTNDFLQLFWLAGQFGGTAWANFDLNSGVVGSVGGSITASIANVGDGWYRCIMTATATATALSSISAVIISSSTSPRAESNTLTTSAFIWGAQLVEGTSPQSYLPTTTRLNVPRLDYTYGTSPASLLEPQRTNIALWSEDLTQTAWVKTNSGTITANTTISPDGTQTADTLTAGAISGQVQQAQTGTSGAVYTVSIWVKRITGTGNVFLRAVENADTLIAVTSDWQRFTATVTSTSTVIRIGVKLATSGDEVAIWGGQIELGAYPTTYIPTTSATATRVADSFSRNNIYTNGLITSSGGTWFVELRGNVAYTRDASSLGLFIDTSNVSLTNGFSIRNPSSSAENQLMITKVVAGTLTPLYSPTTNTTKIAIKWNGTSADIFVNGVKVISATTFTTTNMEFINGAATDVPKYIQQMALYPSPLSDTDCTTLTTL